jgi:hypothetical protein
MSFDGGMAGENNDSISVMLFFGGFSDVKPAGPL